jgi:hypothetical protein
MRRRATANPAAAGLTSVYGVTGCVTHVLVQVWRTGSQNSDQLTHVPAEHDQPAGHEPPHVPPQPWLAPGHLLAQFGVQPPA